MKKRNGFVSNSSSSSFIIRGVKIPTKTLIELMDIDITKADDRYDIEESTELDSWICYESNLVEKLKANGLTCHTIRSYFDGNESGKIIIGKKLEYDDCDGVVTEIEEPNNGEIMDKLKKIGIETNAPLRTYFQYISNDNY